MNTKQTVTLAISGLLVFAACAFSGCESSGSDARSVAYVKPGLIMVPADQARYYGVDPGKKEELKPAPAGLSATDVRSVQSESQITAIQFNRYQDPANPQMMHEAHIVYRRDNQPQWRLQPSSADQQILIGPQLTEGRDELKPVQSQELDAYLREQRVSLQRQQKVMALVTETINRVAAQEQELAKHVTDLESKNNKSADKSVPSKVPPVAAEASSDQKSTTQDRPRN